MFQKSYFIKFLIVFGIFNSSCSVENRLHLSGYNVNWKKSSRENSTQENFLAQNQKISINKTNESIKCENLTAFNSDETIIENNIDYNKASIELIQDSTKTEKCDTIHLKNKVRIEAKVQEIGTKEVKYKNCDNLNGPTIVLWKSDVEKIKFSNGTTEKIIPSSKGKRLEVLGLIAFCISVLAFMVSMILNAYLGSFLAVGAIVLSLLSLIKFLRKKDKYKGKAFPLVAALVALTVLILTGLIFGYSDFFDSFYVEY